MSDLTLIDKLTHPSKNRYGAVGSVFTNRLVFADGRVAEPIMGGASIYALSALLMATPNVVLISGVGADFDRFYGKWFDDNGVSRDALIFRTEKNEYSEVRYLPDGQYECSSIYGAEFRKRVLAELRLGLEDIDPFLDGLTGLYIGGSWDAESCAKICEMKKRTGTKIMWEMQTHMAELPIEQTKRCLEFCDIWSLNRPESFALFGVGSEPEACKRIAELQKPCYYRVGKKGAYMIMDGQCAFAPTVCTVPKEQEIDPTGCGNTSTGGALWAFCEGFSPLGICVWGNVTAGYNVRQYGPYPLMDTDFRREAAQVFAREIAQARELQ